MTGKKLFFTQQELDAIQLAERITSFFSVFGSFFVIGTFLALEIFRKPINRLVFYAAWGNLATNVATIISRSSIVAGVESPLCQLQGFMIQMFMPADSLWTLSMALNVYLTFFHRYSGEELRALERYYVLFNYGLPFIPAFVFLFINHEERGRIFGNATLWCWVTVKWNIFRVATFYGPVWIVLFTTMVIYILVGRVVFENQARFRELSANASKNQANMAATGIPNPIELTVGPDSKTTEVNITSDSCASRANRIECKRASCTIKVTSSTTPVAPKKVKVKKERSSADRAAWSYLKCALLFFTAMVVTWVPATVNRVATLVDPTLTSFGLNFTEALLLPLQGFFNAMIYIAISTDACNYLRVHCKRMFRAIFVNSWKRVLGIPIPLVPIDPHPYRRPAVPRSQSGRPMPPSCGNPQMAPAHLRKPAVKPIQPEEREEYERLHKILKISPEPGSSSGFGSSAGAGSYAGSSNH